MSKILMPVVLVVLTACGSYHQVESGSGKAAEMDAKTASLDFANMEKSVFGPKCTGCHAQFATYAGVMQELSTIATKVGAGQMPLGSPLSPNLKNALKIWIASGTPEVAGKASPPPAAIPLAPTWESLSVNVFIPHCVVCHNPKGKESFLDLSTVDAIFAERDKVMKAANGKKLLDFETPANSFLLTIVQPAPPAPAKQMPPAESNIPTLSEAEVDTLRDWIALDLPLFKKSADGSQP